MEINLKDIIAINYVTLPIVKVLLGTRLLWTIISSCFSGGTWMNSTEWRNNDIWIN